MTLKNEELLSRYFERKMTSSEEQNFLISVAANDELRLAFRSQLELMRAVSNDKDAVRSAVEVRSRTLAALGLSTLAADSFLEHDLLSRQKDETAAQNVAQNIAPPTRSAAPVVHEASSASSIASFFRSPALTVMAGLTAGFIGAFAIFGGSDEQVNPANSTITTPANQIQQPLQSTDQETAEPIQSTDRQAIEAPVQAPSQSASESVQKRQNLTAPRKATVETNTPETGLQNKANADQEPLTVDRQNPGSIVVNPPKISKPSDSAKSTDSQK
jgi:hypothetical protein